ncbi:hypothetical protein ACH5RR_036379, partial [Cinchona calisaya]
VLLKALSGNAPLVIARGGFSGLFPDSSYNAYSLAVGTSLPNVVLWCDVQLTKNGVGIFFPDVKLGNASDINLVFENRHSNTYVVNGIWFSSNNLKFIKTFASGILGPKYTTFGPWIAVNICDSHISIVLDAHKVGLEVFVSEFSSDQPFAYDYHYDPVTEYLSDIDNGKFSADGFLSDFPITPSETIDCFSHMGKNEMDLQVELLIGVHPGCTDKAYKQSIADY